MSGNSQTLVTEGVPECPLCHRTGEIHYKGLKDSIWFTPGEWSYRACTDCEALWIDPRPTPECFNLIYPRDYLTHIEPTDFFSPKLGFMDRVRFEVKLGILRYAYGYDLNRSRTVMRLIQMAATLIPGIKRRMGYAVRFLPARKGRLLDIGCGNGEFLLTMSNLGWEVKGIDPDRIAVSIGRKAGLEIYEGSVESVPLEPNSFDAITLHHVIEHLPDPVRILKRLSTVLRPEGWLVSISPNPASLLSRWFKMAWRGLEPPRHFVLFGPQALANISQQVGLDPVVWTTSRTSEWMARETVSILRHGDIRTYQGQHLPRLIALGCKVLTMINKELGEEVVLIARKK
jgi:SAM-dependent methyltransferase